MLSFQIFLKKFHFHNAKQNCHSNCLRPDFFSTVFFFKSIQKHSSGIWVVYWIRFGRLVSVRIILNAWASSTIILCSKIHTISIKFCCLIDSKNTSPKALMDSNMASIMGVKIYDYQKRHGCSTSSTFSTLWKFNIKMNEKLKTSLYISSIQFLTAFFHWKLIFTPIFNSI